MAALIRNVLIVCSVIVLFMFWAISAGAILFIWKTESKIVQIV